MNDDTGIRRLLRWATTPPQAYVVYLILSSWYMAGLLLCRHLAAEEGR